MVVLATKLYGPNVNAARRSLEALIDNDVGDLEVTTTLGVRRDGFPSVTIDGPDAEAARNFLGERWGTITDRFEPDETYMGTLASWDEAGFEIDAGEPVSVPDEHLGLGVGTPEQVATRFGLIRHLPMRFVAGEPAKLASAELDRLYSWQRGNGRVNANAVTRSQLRATINRAGHADDVVTIERLGLLEQSVICAEGTDPPGLLAAIGDYCPGELACVQ